MKTIVTLLLSMILLGCSHFTIVRSELPTVQPTKTYKIHSFLWAFASGRQLPESKDLCTQSPVQSLDLRMSSVDVLIASATLGIYVPHRVTVTCANP